MASFWLEYHENGQSQEFDFDGHSVTVGRDKSSDFVLDHPTVSRQHAVIVFKNGSYYLVVLSRGGMTAIDGQQVAGEVMLYDGQIVHLGQLQFEFHSHQAPQKSASSHPSSSQAGGGGPSTTPTGFGANAGPGFGGPNHPNSAQAGGHGSPSQFGASGGPSGQGALTSQAGHGQGSSAGFGPPGNSGTQKLDDQVDGQADSSSSGIISWDEIASSSEAMDDDDQKSDTVYERMQQANQDESTNPVVVGVAGVAIAGLLYFVLFAGGGDAAQQTVEKSADEQQPVQIEVECIGKTECLQKAEESYAVAVAALDKKGAAIRRLFDGYKGLLETQTYLDKAGKSSPPAKMADLTARKEKARQALTKIFNRERLDYHNAKRASQYKTMARTLDQIKQYFPDRSARENRWARDKEKKMRKQHIYPAQVYPD